ncbi:alginate lyase family protein [Lachnospiraceae bacterium 62-35]
MADIMWLTNRLKAMSLPEIGWRISQKMVQKSEKRRFKLHRVLVTETLFNQKLSSFEIDAKRMYLNMKNQSYTLESSIPLLGVSDYRDYKKNWAAGFQTEHLWPDVFSYQLEYKQRDDIGDARTNWELNRHFQFAMLAKNYAASGDGSFLQEFQDLFEDWNEKNPFLWGISWTSVMEVAIRTSNWCYAYCFFSDCEGVPEKLLEQLKTGILNMTDYICAHYSRYSSANNHLIVEAYAIGQSGILFRYQPWIDLAIRILTQELRNQNYSDGINKELSLHYQSLYTEAMGLMMRLMVKNDIKIPKIWDEMLDKMCCYMANCIGSYGETIAFGDNDEGKILDLHGGIHHYPYVLGLLSYLLKKQYVSLENVNCENLNWLFTESEKKKAIAKAIHTVPQYICYREGGNSILRSIDRRVLIGIDHAALGFGNIAAHGHADALSFQMYVDGIPIFVDPGTYVYHCDIKSRNTYRKTENHNTLCINKKDQSEMQGAFLWGKRAKCCLLGYEEMDKGVMLRAAHNGYPENRHTRTFCFNGKRKLRIADELEKEDFVSLNFLFFPSAVLNIEEKTAWILIGTIRISIEFECVNEIKLFKTEKMYSEKYGIQAPAPALVVKAQTDSIKTMIQVRMAES